MSETPDEQPTTEESADADDLTHTTDDGDVQMVDVGDKPDSDRRAVAVGEIRLQPSTIEAIRDDGIGKGDVLATARVGAIQAVKHTWETIPMCHQIPITNVDTDFSLAEDRIELQVAVETTGKTGCEMEALEGVTTGLNVVWDMVKAVEKDEDGQYPDTGIENVRVLAKEKQRA
ncbi:cyclic pyranopterin monophosphate synthase MoaC [Natrinema zhouii]|uniref:Probable cyclic pyranopterin monophosphate synthase n=1 Tax=Natrinema zhouii TaxID=1710539 RepID=A0A7D6H7K5_9EURY|nr:cyclic pyranopterin monophosphate synthase MoaC [Natrinema zhouii]QLK26768.1 cyclic pyranopterin monophosphate synthase MoaC [Natrinema zhouii]